MTCAACIGFDHSTLTYCGQCGGRLARGLVGTTLDDRYRIDAKIAAGGFGTIYRATALDSGREVAIKVLHAQHNGDPSVSARFRREAVAMSSLCDPHTVTTYELGEDLSGTRFIVMELLRGESLADRFAACGSLHWRTVLAILRAVCSSLAEAHGLGIVHRDLKPANIFLANEPTPDFVKVLDFGIAKIVHGSNMHDGSELTRIGQAIGTLEYMSPEQLIGGEIDQRTDIYTLGVVAYELITGRRPFSDVTGATGLVTALMTRRPPPPSTVTYGPLPNALDGVLLRCLERDAQDRYANVHELAEALERMLATKSDVYTTQQLWMGAKGKASKTQPVFVDGDEELTWIDARPPCADRVNVVDDPDFSHLEKPAFGDLVAIDMTPRFEYADVIRAQVAPAEPLPPVVPTSVMSPAVESRTTPRPWRVAGTGVDGFDLPTLGFGEEPTQTATPRSMLALGSSPVIAGPQPTQPALLPVAQPVRPAAPPSDLTRIAMIAILLAIVGLAAGAGIAMFVL